MAKHPLGVLILHGLTSSIDCVSGINAPLVAQGIPTRMPILRGHGAESPEALRNVKWQDWVDDGEAALQELLTEAEEVVIVGHSMGTLVAITLAAEHTGEPWLNSVVFAAPAVQLAAPFAPGRPLAFLTPVLKRVLKKWDMPPVYADKSLEKFDTNYAWAPITAITEFLDFSGIARKRLSEIDVPALILQSHKDTTVAPESAEIAYAELATPPNEKRIVWFEHTEHEMFRDCEREAAVQAIADFVQERLAGQETG